MVEFSIEREEKLGWIFPFLQRYFLIRLSHYAATTFHGLRTLQLHLPSRHGGCNLAPTIIQTRPPIGRTRRIIPET